MTYDALSPGRKPSGYPAIVARVNTRDIELAAVVMAEIVGRSRPQGAGNASTPVMDVLLTATPGESPADKWSNLAAVSTTLRTIQVELPKLPYAIDGVQTRLNALIELLDVLMANGGAPVEALQPARLSPARVTEDFDLIASMLAVSNSTQSVIDGDARSRLERRVRKLLRKIDEDESLDPAVADVLRYHAEAMEDALRRLDQDGDQPLREVVQRSVGQLALDPPLRSQIEQSKSGRRYIALLEFAAGALTFAGAVLGLPAGEPAPKQLAPIVIEVPVVERDQGTTPQGADNDANSGWAHETGTRVDELGTEVSNALD